MTSVAKRVQKHRVSLRKSGLRPLQIWVPDTKRQGFAAECKRQSRLLKNDPHEKEVVKFLGETTSCEEWTE